MWWNIMYVYVSLCISVLFWCLMHKQEVDLNIIRLFSVDEQLLENLLKNLNAI